MYLEQINTLSFSLGKIMLFYQIQRVKVNGSVKKSRERLPIIQKHIGLLV